MYCCETLFSVETFVTSKYRAALTNERLKELTCKAYRLILWRLANKT